MKHKVLGTSTGVLVMCSAVFTARTQYLVTYNAAVTCVVTTCVVVKRGAGVVKRRLYVQRGEV